MGKKLFVTEKPSVAASFASVLGLQMQKSDRAKGYAESKDTIVTWCFGHLVTMAYPDAYDAKFKEWKTEHLPIIPEQYKYVVLEDGGAAKQYGVISMLMCREDVDVIYACTDSGREGEYIFRLVYTQCGSSKPVKRVWISSQTDEALNKGIEEAKDSREYDFLGKAAYWRAKEDWLFGMNFSRIFTCRYSRSLSKELQESKAPVIAIGRVMTCVLGLVVERELEIRNFVPEIRYGVSANFLSQEHQISYKGRWVCDKDADKNPDKNADKKNADASGENERHISREEAMELIERLKDQEAVVKKVEVKLKNEQPPLLFNLAELQSEGTKKFKIPVDRTLEIAQGLYEKKLISYPRTDSRVISTDVLEELPKVLNGLYKNPAFGVYVKRIKELGGIRINKTTKRYVDNSKVTDHYAIIPTNVTVDPATLDPDSRKVYELIVKRFLAAFYPPAIFNTVKVETEIKEGSKGTVLLLPSSPCFHCFVSNAKTLKEAGWKEIYEVAPQKGEEEADNSSPIHNLVKKEKCTVSGFDLEEKETKPPSRYTDGSLILTMEKAGKFIENEELREQIKTCGIGTSATRAGIIKKLRDIGYININSKTQIITPSLKGEKIVELVRREARELLNPSLTASWEKGLVMIENREITEEVFQEKLYSYIRKTIEKVKLHS